MGFMLGHLLLSVEAKVSLWLAPLCTSQGGQYRWRVLGFLFVFLFYLPSAEDVLLIYFYFLPSFGGGCFHVASSFYINSRGPNET
jgi:hypothetical protein